MNFSQAALGIPTIALSAYPATPNKIVTASDPACGISWNLLAGYLVASNQCTPNGGANRRPRHPRSHPIYGASAWMARWPGNEVIVQSNVKPAESPTPRAMGPMQFLARHLGRAYAFRRQRRRRSRPTEPVRLHAGRPRDTYVAAGLNLARPDAGPGRDP